MCTCFTIHIATLLHAQQIENEQKFNLPKNWNLYLQSPNILAFGS
jgi:hypothetical protein